MILGYLWLVAFSRFPYDHTDWRPFPPSRPPLHSSCPRCFIDRADQAEIRPCRHARWINLLTWILMLAAAVVAAGALHHFRLVGLDNIYNFRDEIGIPAWLRYAMGARRRMRCCAVRIRMLRGPRQSMARGGRPAAVAAVLPGYAHQAGAVCAVLAACFWRCCPASLQARTSVVLSLLLPLLFARKSCWRLPVAAGTHSPTGERIM